MVPAVGVMLAYPQGLWGLVAIVAGALERAGTDRRSQAE
jgi:hypothetical protein